MTRPLLSLALAAAVALGAAGCGTDDVDPAAVAEAAQATRAAETANVDWRVTTKGFGLPTGLTIDGAGTTSLDSARMDLRFDLAPLLALAGAGAGGGEAQVVVRGRRLYVRPPELEGLALPGGAEWVALDLLEAVEATGTDAAGLAEIMTLDPGAQIDVLRSAEGVEEVGPATIEGAKTTHYRGELSLRDYAKGLPAERRKRAEAAIEEFTAETGGDEAQPFEVWIDERDRIRRMRQTSEVPAQEGVPGGEVAVTMQLSDFGTELDAEAPPEGETYDATRDVSDALAASS